MLRDIETSIIKHNATEMDNLIYLNNEDMIVIRKFSNLHKGNWKADASYSQTVSTSTINNEKVLLLKSIAYNSFSPKKELSIKRIKEVLSIYYKSLIFNRGVRVNDTISKYDTLLISNLTR